MRAFIALEVPSSVEKHIRAFQEKLADVGIRARWTRPENMHITLAFIPDLTQDKLPSMETILADTVFQRFPIQLKTSGFKRLSKRATPTLMAFAVEGELKKLGALVKTLRRGLDREKIDYDHKPFIPHITIARNRLGFPMDELTDLAQDAVSEAYYTKVTVYSSEITEQGPLYTRLKSTYLGSKTV